MAGSSSIVAITESVEGDGDDDEQVDAEDDSSQLSDHTDDSASGAKFAASLRIPPLCRIYDIPSAECGHTPATEATVYHIWSYWRKFRLGLNLSVFVEYWGLNLYPSIPSKPPDSDAREDRPPKLHSVTSFDRNCVIEFFKFLSTLGTASESRIFRNATTFFNIHLKLEYYNRLRAAGYEPYLSNYINVGSFPEVIQIRRANLEPKSSNRKRNIDQTTSEPDATSNPEGYIGTHPCPRLPVDWFDMAETVFGKDSLVKYLSENEVNELIGWATHHGPPTPPPFKTGRNRRRSRVFPHPTCDIPNIPLQPSIFGNLRQQASKILEAHDQDPMKNEPHAFLSGTTDRPSPWGRYDQSALVAVGIAVEEMITASLHGLAQLHVLRCQELQAREDMRPLISEAAPYSDAESSYEAWTLPPEEAILKLLYRSVPPTNASQSPGSATRCSGLPTTQVATRSIQAGATRGPSLLGVIPPPQSQQSYAVAQWCATHDLSAEVVSANNDLFELLISKAMQE
jgi:hypothetical protein